MIENEQKDREWAWYIIKLIEMVMAKQIQLSQDTKGLKILQGES